MPTFAAAIEDAARGGAVVATPGEEVEEPGGGGHIPVQASFDGVPYQGSIVRIGDRSVLGVLAAIRQQLDKQPGYEVTVVVERDTTERTVEVPEDLATALARNAVASVVFADLAFSHKRECVNWINEAK